MASENGNVYGHIALFSLSWVGMKTMAETIKEERLRWILPIAQRQIRLIDAAKVCPYGKKSWKALTEAGPR